MKYNKRCLGYSHTHTHTAYIQYIHLETYLISSMNACPKEVKLLPNKVTEAQWWSAQFKIWFQSVTFTNPELSRDHN
jgi:hypothetical protein